MYIVCHIIQFILTTLPFTISSLFHTMLKTHLFHEIFPTTNSKTTMLVIISADAANLT